MEAGQHFGVLLALMDVQIPFAVKCHFNGGIPSAEGSGTNGRQEGQQRSSRILTAHNVVYDLAECAGQYEALVRRMGRHKTKVRQTV